MECCNYKKCDDEYTLDINFLNYIMPTLDKIDIEHDMDKKISHIERNVNNKRDIHNALKEAYIAGFNKKADISRNIKIKY